MDLKSTFPRLSRLLRDSRGLSTVEYVIILMLVAIVGIVTWQTFGETIAAKTGIAEQRLDELGGEGSQGSQGSPGSDTTTGGEEAKAPPVKRKFRTE